MPEKNDTPNNTPAAAPAVTTAAAPVEDTTASELTLRNPNWKSRLRDEARRGVVDNARAYLSNQDRKNPMHFLYLTIDQMAALLDEQELEIKRLRENQR